METYGQKSVDGGNVVTHSIISCHARLRDAVSLFKICIMVCKYISSAYKRNCH